MRLGVTEIIGSTLYRGHPPAHTTPANSVRCPRPARSAIVYVTPTPSACPEQLSHHRTKVVRSRRGCRSPLLFAVTNGGVPRYRLLMLGETGPGIVIGRRDHKMTARTRFGRSRGRPVRTRYSLVFLNTFAFFGANSDRFFFSGVCSDIIAPLCRGASVVEQGVFHGFFTYLCTAVVAIRFRL